MKPERDDQTSRALAVLVGLGEPPPASWLEPLIELSTEPRLDIAEPAAVLLTRLSVDRVVAGYAKLAIDPARSLDRRILAINYLGSIWHEESLQALLAVAEQEPVTRLNQLALRALRSVLSPHLGESPSLEAMRAWINEPGRWESERRLSLLTAQSFRQSLLQRAASIGQGIKLRQAARRVYRLTPADEQASVLLEYLTDNTITLKQLGIDLVLQRLEQRQAIGEPMRSALRVMIDDPEPDLRERAVSVLLSLDDDPASERVAIRLAQGLETDHAVESAMLRMLVRKPSIEALPVLLRMLSSDERRPLATEAVLATYESDFLVGDQLERVREEMLSAESLGREPTHASVRLLSAVAGDEHRASFLAWLDHPSPVIRQAATEAWLDHPDWPMEPMLARLDAPVVGPLILRRLEMHPRPDLVMVQLVGQREDLAADSPAYLLLLQLAPRLDELRLLEMETSLHHVSLPLRLGLVDAWLRSRAEEPMKRSLAVRVRSAQMHLMDNGEGAVRALGQLAALIDADLDDLDRTLVDRAAELGLLAASRSGQLDKATQFASLALGDTASESSRLALLRLLQQLVHENLAANEHEMAQRLFLNLRPLLGEPQNDQERSTIEALRATVLPEAQALNSASDPEASAPESNTPTGSDESNSDTVPD